MVKRFMGVKNESGMLEWEMFSVNMSERVAFYRRIYAVYVSIFSCNNNKYLVHVTECMEMLSQYAFMWDGCTIIVISANVVMTVAGVFIQLLHFIMNDENFLWGDVWCFRLLV